MIWINNRKKEVAKNINHVTLMLSGQETLQLVLA